MDILSLTNAGVASGLWGGLFGALGSGLGRIVGIFEMREKRQDRAIEIAREKELWAHEAELQALQMRMKAQDTENALKLGAHGLEKTGLDGSWAGLDAAIAAEARIGPSYKWVDAVRALVRPVLTVLVWLVFCILFFMTPTGVPDIAATFVNTVTFAASTALAWWFGDRGPKDGIR